MSPRKSSAATQRQTETTDQDPALPGVLISPSNAKENQRDAYWLQLAGDPDAFSDAIKTSDFWELLAELPEPLWSETLRLYLYRKPADDGVMVKNAPGEWNYLRIFYKPVDQQFVADNFGGGKYEFRLNWVKEKNNKTIKRHTFPIDGPPKVKPGQVVELDGKPVPLASPVAPPTNERTDLATAIDSTSKANETAMRILENASEKALDMVESRAAATTNAPQKSGLSDVLELVSALKALMPPATDPIATLRLAKDLFTQPNPAPVEAPEPKDPPISEAMQLVEQFTGKPFSEMIRGGKNSAAPPENTWAWLTPFAPVAEKFVMILPHLWQQSRYSKDLEFRRAVFLKSAPPGTPIPQDLLLPPAPPAPAASAAPAQPSATVTNINEPAPNQLADKMQLAGYIVHTVADGFKRNPRMGYQTAAKIDFDCGEQIEAAGLDKLFADDKTITEFVHANPILAPLTQDARWPKFQEDFMVYMGDRFGTDEEADDQQEKVAGPQPVA